MGAQGTAILDFGAFPGASDASVTVTGASLVGIAAASLVEAWIFPLATADHTSDEHWVESLAVFADPSTIVADTSFVIRGRNTSEIFEALVEPLGANSVVQAATAVANKNAQPGRVAYGGGQGTRLYGQFTVAWVWN